MILPIGVYEAPASVRFSGSFEPCKLHFHFVSKGGRGFLAAGWRKKMDGFLFCLDRVGGVSGLEICFGEEIQAIAVVAAPLLDGPLGILERGGRLAQVS